MQKPKVKYTDFDLPVTVAGVRFRNPFYVSSGPTTMSIEQIRRIEHTGWGGASLKLTIFPTPYINRRPRYSWYDRQGYLAFTAEKRLELDELLRLIEQARREAPNVVLFSNITYSEPDVDGWVKMAAKCEAAGAHINELNFGCPNMSFNLELSGAETDGHRTGASMGRDAGAVAEVVRAVKAATSIPAFVKLCPEGGQIAVVARAAIDAGADAVGSNANRLAIVPLDLDEPGAAHHPLQKQIGLSCMQGPWVLPLGKRDCFEIRTAIGPEAHVTATGGVNEWRDAVEMVMCGADLVGICTKTITHGFDWIGQFIHGVKQYIAEKSYADFGAMRDIAIKELHDAAEMTIFDGRAEIVNPNLVAPCVEACPAHVPAQGYVRAVADEDFETAYKLIVSKNPFQSICGLICDHPCETACTRAFKDAPLRIRDIKDFVLRHARHEGWTPDIITAQPRDEKVAVVGAGPAGLSAAYDLARAGYQVTVFEKSDDAGGVLRRHIPRFRMGEDELDTDIQSVRSLGVNIRTNTALGKDFTIETLKGDGYAGIFVAVGAWSPGTPGIPGEKADGCVAALELLCDIATNKLLLTGKRVAVIGGGFTAVDAARSAVRAGAAEVYILYRRTRDEMPATPEELAEAEAEGVRVMYLVAPKEILTADTAVEAIRMVNHTLGDPDASGRRRPESVEGAEFVLRVETVVFATSQQVDDSACGKLAPHRGFIKADPKTLATNIDRVWAGGDCIGGRMDVIQAVADGKRAAAYIDQAIAGDEARLAPEPQLDAVDVDDVLQREGDDPRRWRVPVNLRPAAQRAADWQTYREPMTRDQAVAEAARCYACGCGAGCAICMQLCSQFAYELDGWRMVLDGDKCVACGMCVWRCPNQNIRFKQTSDEPV